MHLYVYIYIYIYAYIYNNTYSIYVHTQPPHTHTHTHIYPSLSMYVYIYIYTHIHMYLYGVHRAREWQNPAPFMKVIRLVMFSLFVVVMLMLLKLFYITMCYALSCLSVLSFAYTSTTVSCGAAPRITSLTKVTAPRSFVERSDPFASFPIPS